MLKTIVLVTSITIVKSEIMHFVEIIGNYSEDPDNIYDGQLYNDNGYFWVMYDPEEELSGSELEAKIKNIIPKLGSTPQTEILLDIGKNVQSEILAAEFVRKFDRVCPVWWILYRLYTLCQISWNYTRPKGVGQADRPPQWPRNTSKTVWSCISCISLGGPHHCRSAPWPAVGSNPRVTRREPGNSALCRLKTDSLPYK
ncbi:MAG: hypothetical protein AB4352_07665 [Hormoscilla sp.]